MPITWEHESEHLLVAAVSGRMVTTDIGEFQKAVEPIVQASGHIQFLVILDNFEGWESGEGWEDTSFADANDQYLARFAIVGDEKWRDQILMFSLAGMRPVEIEYFAADKEAAARAWLADA